MIFGYVFNLHLSFLLEDAGSVLEAQQIDFSVLRLGPATFSHPMFSVPVWLSINFCVNPRADTDIGSSKAKVKGL